jgi:glycosyltransferase involved in cell wall biosynthesis
MKIALVSGEYPPMQGGVGDFSREIVLAWAEQGHVVSVYTDRRNQLPSHETRLYQHFPIVHPDWGWCELWRLRPRLNQADVVNIQYQAAAYGKMRPPIHFLPRLLSRPTFITFHDLRIPYLFPKAGALRTKALQWLAQASTGAIATNPEDAHTLKQNWQVANVREIPIGSNIPNSPPPDYHKSIWRAQYGILPNEFVLGYFGFLNPSKGGETIIAALANLLEQGVTAKLLLIGGQAGSSDPATNNAFATDLQALAQNLGVADHIVRTGYLPAPQTSAALLCCDLMLQPYRDGASFRRGTFMACLNHGKPTITTQPRVPLPQLIHGENSWLVQVDNPQQLASAARHLLENPALQTKLSQGALALSKAFGWQGIAQQTVSFFQESTHF